LFSHNVEDGGNTIVALTKRQKEVLEFVANFQMEHGFSPSYEEIGRALQVTSLATVHKHVLGLEARGYIRRAFNHSRSIEVTQKIQQENLNLRGKPISLEIPLAGRIAAGVPVETYPGTEKLSFSDFVGHEGTFALEVRGDSMIEDHICDGDYVLVEKTSQVRDGDIVVALVDGSETTLKRYYRDSNQTVRLQPANSEMAPIRVPANRVQIQGRVLAVLRKYK
jgi:repressor LexA